MESIPSPCRAAVRQEPLEISASEEEEEVQVLSVQPAKLRRVDSTSSDLRLTSEPTELALTSEVRATVDSIWSDWLRREKRIGGGIATKSNDLRTVRRLFTEFSDAPEATVRAAFEAAFLQLEAPAPWTCPECDEPNKADRERCNNCSTVRPRQCQLQAPSVDRWTCSMCDEPNKAERIFCNSCGQPRAKPRKTWICPRCDELNKDERDQCNACGWMKRTRDEMQIGFEAVLIGQALTRRFQVREERKAALKALGGLGTCNCCFDEQLLPEEEVRCNGPEGHGFCIFCVQRAALEFFGAGLFTLNFSHASASSSVSAAGRVGSAAPLDFSHSQLRCMNMLKGELHNYHESACKGHFSDAALQRALPRQDYVRYSRRSAALQAASSGIPDLESCPACDFMIQMSDSRESILRCLDPECGKVTCRRCRQPAHPGQRCEEVEKDAETRIRTFLQEKLSEIRLRRCPNVNCRKPYERVEGCNHISCPCGTHSCFLCGQTIDPIRPYDHYRDGHVGGGKDAQGSRCIVYGTPAWSEKTDAEVRREAEKALSNFLEKNPDLKEAAKQLNKEKRAKLDHIMSANGQSPPPDAACKMQ